MICPSSNQNKDQDYIQLGIYTVDARHNQIMQSIGTDEKYCLGFKKIFRGNK